MYESVFGSSYFQLYSLAYMILIAVVFIKRKKLKTVDNTIFSLLIITNIIGVILDVTSVYMGFFTPNNPYLILISKLYLIYLIAYLLIYLLYFMVLSKKSLTTEEKIERFKTQKKFFVSLFCIFATLILCLPLHFNSEEGHLFSYGPAAIFTYIISGISFIAMIVLLIRQRKNLSTTKKIVILAIVFLGTVAAIIQLFNPQLLLVTAAGVLGTVILYLTVFLVENPDLKLIEEIQQSREEAERANKSKTEFLSNMSHEIRTPLNAILGFSQGLLEENLQGEAKEDAEDIVNASDSLLSIVNEILDISKIESDKLEIENGEYTFDKIYRYLVTMTQGRLGNKRLEFIHNCADNIPKTLYGDSVRIKQIVVNLLTNSVKYTQQGYVKLDIGCEILDKDTCRLTIEVSDSGIGIKEEDLKKLFSKFERFDNEKNINVEGTGLGLALTKRLVELMNGEIKVESDYGHGSTFTVIFNQKIVSQEEQVNETQQETQAPSFDGQGKKVLIVDDNTVNLKVANRFLKDYNLQIELSSSGKDFIKKVNSGNVYDLVLLDDMMPEMSGKDTLKYLKENTNYNVPTIALTANALAGMKEEYLKDGFDDYLSKPIDKMLLEEILIKFLGKDQQTPPTNNENTESTNQTPANANQSTVETNQETPNTNQTTHDTYQKEQNPQQTTPDTSQKEQNPQQTIEENQNISQQPVEETEVL